MADIAAGDVTYTIKSQSRDSRGKKQNIVELTFGDGALTYPADGIPLTKANMGCPSSVDAFLQFASTAAAVGYIFSYDKATEKLLMTQAPVQTHSHSLSLKNAAVADSTGARVNAGTNLLGANTGSDITVAGGGANGGVASATLAAAKLSQASAIAIAAQTIQVMVIGF
jgi:hypothetical protein